MRYERPFVIATYSVEQLRAEAAGVCCASIHTTDQESDQSPKTDIRSVDDPLKRFGRV